MKTFNLLIGTFTMILIIFLISEIVVDVYSIRERIYYNKVKIKNVKKITPDKDKKDTKQKSKINITVDEDDDDDTLASDYQDDVRVNSDSSGNNNSTSTTAASSGATSTTAAPAVPAVTTAAPPAAGGVTSTTAASGNGGGGGSDDNSTNSIIDKITLGESYECINNNNSGYICSPPS